MCVVYAGNSSLVGAAIRLAKVLLAIKILQRVVEHSPWAPSIPRGGRAACCHTKNRPFNRKTALNIYDEYILTLQSVWAITAAVDEFQHCRAKLILW